MLTSLILLAGLASNPFDTLKVGDTMQVVRQRLGNPDRIYTGPNELGQTNSLWLYGRKATTFYPNRGSVFFGPSGRVALVIGRGPVQPLSDDQLKLLLKMRSLPAFSQHINTDEVLSVVKSLKTLNPEQLRATLLEFARTETVWSRRSITIASGQRLDLRDIGRLHLLLILLRGPGYDPKYYEAGLDDFVPQLLPPLPRVLFIRDWPLIAGVLVEPITRSSSRLNLDWVLSDVLKNYQTHNYPPHIPVLDQMSVDAAHTVYGVPTGGEDRIWGVWNMRKEKRENLPEPESLFPMQEHVSPPPLEIHRILR